MDPLALLIQKELSHLTGGKENPSSTRYLLAVSGGMDSMVMAHSFLKLKLNFGIAHFNFKLRGEDSELDEQLAGRFCRDHQIPFFTRSEDTNQYARERKISTQEAARELRYTFFENIVKNHDFDFICTAHHGNDQVETLFINLFRGSGLKGLSGMPQRRGQIIRPMLWIPHDEIVRFAREHKVEYRLDTSNLSDKYLRNRIRHHIIEPLTESHPQYLNKALDSISLLGDYQNYITNQLNLFRKEKVWKLSPDIQNINFIEKIISEPANLFILKLFLLDEGMYPDSVRVFTESSGQWQTGSRYEGHQVNAWYDRNNLWLIRDSFYEDWSSEDVLELSIGSDLELPGGDRLYYISDMSERKDGSNWIIPIKLDKVELPLILRHRIPGDVIELGHPPYSHRSLKKFFHRQQIPRPFRDRLYVLTDARNRIIAIPGEINSPAYTDPDNADVIIGYETKLQFYPTMYM